jgi:hypothetical protein
VITTEGNVAFGYVGDHPVDRPTVDDLIEQVKKAAADTPDAAAPSP